MERDEAVGRLPVTYQKVLAWVGEGRSDDEIALGLGIDPRAVSPLIVLAEAKLARLTRATDDENEGVH